MDRLLGFYIDGQWTTPEGEAATAPVINPATEETIAEIYLGSAADIDRAVAAARAAFDAYSTTPVAQRIELAEEIVVVFKRRYDEMVDAIISEMGAPHDLSYGSQAACGPGHFEATIAALKSLTLERKSGRSGNVVLEPIGVCGLIIPWNWPINQLACKVAPALLAGCTMVLKPSELSPLSAHLFAEIVDEVGVPPGVFNLVHGEGPVVGARLAEHPDVDLVSLTGSTRAGAAVAKAAADSVKRVLQELGGKSPNVIFEDADVEGAVRKGVLHCFENTGQSCNAPTRMLVHESIYEQAVSTAVRVGEGVEVGDPTESGSHIGPLVSKSQFDKVQRLINTGIDEGAQVALGGPGKPEGRETGYFVKPTIFVGVNNEMTIAREEIFGPVLCVIPFADEEEAIRIANDTPYGLGAYVHTQDWDRARRVARRLKAGSVYLNGNSQDYDSPFGGYKQSGNGREWGGHGLEEFLEKKVINGFYAEKARY